MKELFISLAVLFSLPLFAQEIQQREVPPTIVIRFQSLFPDALDIEWKRVGENYKVEFEIGVLSIDHSVWFDKTGEIVQHKEEIKKSNMPQKVLLKIASDFNGYHIEDPKKTTKGEIVIYEVELKTNTSELKITFDENGNVLSKKED